MAPNGVQTVTHQVFEYFGRSLEWLKNWGTTSEIPYDYELRMRRFDGNIGGLTTAGLDSR
jgi:hypothetical protein